MDTVRKLATAMLLITFAGFFLGLAACSKIETKNPVISGFTPQHGPVGTQVTITGSRFSTISNGNVVKFNNVQATVVSATATQIVVTVPVGATSGTITVTTPDGPGGTNSIFTVTILLGGSVQGVPLSLAGSVTTVAGVAGTVGSTDGVGSAALFRQPFGLATDGTTLFITDQGNQTIRSMDIASGVVETIAGAPGSVGVTDGLGPAARFNLPAGITINNGSLYICDSANHTIRQMVLGTGQVSTLAGIPGVPGTADGTTGLGSTARFNGPQGITTDGTFLYVSDSGNHTIRRIDPVAGAVVTIAGTPPLGAFADGFGTAARFNNPVGVTCNGTQVFITDQNNQRLRTLALANLFSVTTIASSVGLFPAPSGITTDGILLYVSDIQSQTIRQVDPLSGAIFIIAGSGVAGSADGIGTVANFRNPAGITTDGTALFVADTTNNTIRKIQ